MLHSYCNLSAEEGHEDARAGHGLVLFLFPLLRQMLPKNEICQVCARARDSYHWLAFTKKGTCSTGYHN